MAGTPGASVNGKDLVGQRGIGNVSVEQAAEEVEKRHRRSLMAYAIHAGLSYHKAEDAVNRTLWVFCRKLGNFQPVHQHAVATFLFYIHRHVCRKLANSRTVCFEPLPPDETLQLSYEPNLAFAMELREAMSKQPLHCRQILLLKITGFTFKEIAAKVDSPQATVAGRYYKAIRQLRRDLVAAGR